MPRSTPATTTDVIATPIDWGFVSRAAIAFHDDRAVIVSAVSKVCGNSFGPGMLCTRVPASMTVLSGEPGVSSTVNERYVSAATPGRGSRPTCRASWTSDTRSVAVPRYASLAIRSW